MQPSIEPLPIINEDTSKRKGGKEAARLPAVVAAVAALHALVAWPGATLSFYAAIGCHSLGICTVIWLSLLPFPAEMTAPPPGDCRPLS